MKRLIAVLEAIRDGIKRGELRVLGCDVFKEENVRRDQGGKFSSTGGGGGGGGGATGQKDIGKLLGQEYTGVKGQAAINKLLQTKGGHVKGAFEHPDIGKIDLLWGDKKQKIGLAHIINERQKRKRDPKELLSNLTAVIEHGYVLKDANGKPITNKNGRWEIYLDNKVAVITPEVRGNKITALLTAYYDD